MHVLVLRLSALGDVAMTIPAIYSVARTYPQHRFTVLTAAFMSRLFIGAPSNIEVLPLSKEESRGVGGTWRLLRKLNTLEDIDAVADLHNVLRSWLVDSWYRLRGKPVAMLNKLRGERRDILKKKAQTARPFVQRYFDVFSRLGLASEPQFTSLFPDALPPLPEDFAPKGEERWVGIAPFARYENKTYPQEQMEAVVQQLSAEDNLRIFLFGARGKEAEILQSWVCSRSNVHVVAGLLPLEQELALMVHLNVMVTMDSANMHLASLVKTRVVSIWGSTTPACGFLGFEQREEDALMAGLPCQPCTIAGSKRCHRGGRECLYSVLPSEIVKNIHRVLNEHIMKQ